MQNTSSQLFGRVLSTPPQSANLWKLVRSHKNYWVKISSKFRILCWAFPPEPVVDKFSHYNKSNIAKKRGKWVKVLVEWQLTDLQVTKSKFFGRYLYWLDTRPMNILSIFSICYVSMIYRFPLCCKNIWKPLSIF